MTQWVKQLTRENTLFDRSLRAIAYNDSIKEVGQSSISNCLLVGIGGITSLYYDKNDYIKQQKIIIEEFKDDNIIKMSRKIVDYLEQGYSWSKSLRNRKLSQQELLNYYNVFKLHHAHARGAIVYGYWGEPIISNKLRRILKKRSIDNIDNSLSILSSPKLIKSQINKLCCFCKKSELNKIKLLNQYNFSKKDRELVEILSWFTWFYELGERVSTYLYRELLNHLEKTFNHNIIKEIEWYDPNSFEKYLKGIKISESEIKSRRKIYILKMIDGKWELLIGDKANTFFNKHLVEKVNTNKKTIKGTTACLGYAKGIVKIVITQEDMREMDHGDILVSTMTTPQLIMAVKKASAIVTDEGGLTAHAAIVSRELGIPCVIGTKIATKVLKDGDFVEVNANKGIVKIIK